MSQFSDIIICIENDRRNLVELQNIFFVYVNIMSSETRRFVILFERSLIEESMVRAGPWTPAIALPCVYRRHINGHIGPNYKRLPTFHDPYTIL